MREVSSQVLVDALPQTVRQVFNSARHHDSFVEAETSLLSKPEVALAGIYWVDEAESFVVLVCAAVKAANAETTMAIEAYILMRGCRERGLSCLGRVRGKSLLRRACVDEQKS